MATAKVIIDIDTGTILDYDACVVVDLDTMSKNGQDLWRTWLRCSGDGDAIELGRSEGKALG